MSQVYGTDKMDMYDDLNFQIRVNLNFQSPETVSRYRDSQLQVTANLNLISAVLEVPRLINL